MAYKYLMRPLHGSVVRTHISCGGFTFSFTSLTKQTDLAAIAALTFVARSLQNLRSNTRSLIAQNQYCWTSGKAAQNSNTRTAYRAHHGPKGTLRRIDDIRGNPPMLGPCCAAVEDRGPVQAQARIPEDR